MSTITSILSLVTTHWISSLSIGSVLTALIPFAGNILSAGSLTYIKMGIYGAIALALVGSGAFVTYEVMNGKLKAAEAQVANATAKADTQALKEEQAYEAKANKAIEDAQAYATEQSQREATFRKEIYVTKKTYACIRTPAFGALLNSMR